MAAIRLRSNNRKLPPLPPPDTLALDDKRRWAVLFTQARIRKRMTYLTLATLAGVSTTQTVEACTRGACGPVTILKLAHVLDLDLPAPPHVLTAKEALHGRSA